MRRLSVVDEIFLRTHRGLGTPIALQGLWRTEDPVEPVELARLHAALRTGPLGRRVVRPRIPGARSRWQSSDRAHRLDLHGAAVAPEEIPGWADTRGALLDPEHGPGWRLSAAPLTTGGTIVALTCSHVLADARGLIIAVERALQELDSGADADTPARPGNGTTPEPAGAQDSDWADAARIWATVAFGGMRAAAARIPRGLRIPRGEWNPDPGKAAVARGPAVGGTADAAHAADAPAPDRPEASPDPHSASGHGEMSEPALILRCPAEEWERIATAYRGTANSLFIWTVANMLWAAGFPATEITASLPVDTRDELRIDNDLAMTEIAVTPQDGPADIRAKSRAAYERRISAPGGLPEEFLYLVPDRVAHLLSRGAGERDILCSNIGPVPPALSALGSSECTGLATRALHPGLRYGDRPRTRLSGYLCRFRDDYILTFASLYPERIADAAALHRLATATAERVDLPIRPW
ncbi:hypothetical protein [Nocardia sp. NBC_01329]|uniref:hypothetical protein n=1 Tax=Nocardia sp. NBC_01329 TaxID=2903594 RepID=UPI002E13117C|nr:hypothetical protein OG405_00085 [Nocardia sp. NBC_01329]